ncbi:natural killer cells antigen CD94-like isoform X3 [Rousettus aegyptiacus]|uniref:natural killer cells antigen CD94-like isoform X3 n=1 Tax=Rousettus aegyptiacus TaxID=9407 RepID=UPI00168D8976|nr:natural killer cells antigen CD94-like isoform X3 [Rousettus aegyptiacus]
MAGFQTTPWRLISGILGLMCLVLMITLGMLWKFCSSCCSCQEKWIGYQCNCYFISSETKTWAESRNFCASQNSSLLQLKNGTELHFIKSSGTFYWIGLSYNKDHHAWLWEDGSALSQDLFSSLQNTNIQKCITYNPMNTFMGESCRYKNHFICCKR